VVSGGERNTVWRLLMEVRDGIVGGGQGADRGAVG
jgi:hypothetical protein